MWQVAALQFKDPMTLMLVAVAAVSFLIAQPSTAWVVIALIALNVVMGTNQEMKARASVEALASLQVPVARVTRDGELTTVEARDLVPGDLVSVEAGDIVPADGRIVVAASVETQEAALTGESAPVAKGVASVDDADAALGDRTDMLFQNTSVTRGSATFVVTETGMSTEVGRIATMLGEVRQKDTPLQVQLGDLTRKIAFVAWGALAIILVVGLIRGLPFSDLMLLGISMAISAIPTGLPTFVQTMLAFGAKELARGEGDRAQPQRRRDPRRHHADLHRQDRHPDPQPDDRPGRVSTRGSGCGSAARATAPTARSARWPAARSTSPPWPT